MINTPNLASSYVYEKRTHTGVKTTGYVQYSSREKVDKTPFSRQGEDGDVDNLDRTSAYPVRPEEDVLAEMLSSSELRLIKILMQFSQSVLTNLSHSSSLIFVAILHLLITPFCGSAITTT